MLFPNAVKILESVGYNRDLARAVVLRGFRTYDPEGTEQTDHFIDMKAMFGADWLAQKRSDFREELLRLATEEQEGKGFPARMVWNTPVIDVEPESGIVTLENGGKDQGDVVISKCLHE